MSAPIVLSVAGNTAPSFQVTLKRNGTVINLVGVVSVSMVITDAQTKLVTNAGHQACTVVTPSDGVISYAPAAGDLVDGRYFGEVHVKYDSTHDEWLHELVQIICRPKTG